MGIQFLKHLTRTRVLLHLVDIMPIDGTTPADAIRTIWNELKQFSPELAQKEQWLVFNKTDLLPADEVAERVAES